MLARPFTYLNLRRMPHAGFPLLLIASLLAGCGNRSGGPELGTVTGVVILDGEPLADAMVTFSPVDQRRESYSVTDARGRYEVRYNSRTKGAEVGQHEVRVSSQGVEPKAPRNKKEDSGKVPAHYSGKDFLLIDVKPGANKIDLELTSNPPAKAS